MRKYRIKEIQTVVPGKYGDCLFNYYEVEYRNVGFISSLFSRWKKIRSPIYFTLDEAKSKIAKDKLEQAALDYNRKNNYIQIE